MVGCSKPIYSLDQRASFHSLLYYYPKPWPSIYRIDSIDSIGSIDSMDCMDRKESRDRIDSVDSIQSHIACLVVYANGCSVH